MQFKIESRRTPIVTESEIPLTVTNEILEKAKFKELPETYSATIEDFLVDSIHKGKDLETIKQESEILSGKLDEVVNKIQEETSKVDWGSILNSESENIIKQNLIDNARKIGANLEIEQSINEIKFDLSDSMGVSSSGEKAEVAKNQIVRKALDYVKVFPEENLDNVIRTLTLTTMTHEAGHIIDEKFEIYSNRIPNDEKWNKADNRSERFAEFWAHIVDIQGTDLSIREQEKLIHVMKISEMWSAIKKYNKKYPEIGIHQLFNLIQSENEQVKNWVYARRVLYGRARPENYASPYTLEKLQEYR